MKHMAVFWSRPLLQKIRYSFFVICFLVVSITSQGYLPQQLLIERPYFSLSRNSTVLDGFRKALALESNVNCSRFNAIFPERMTSDRCICSHDAATFSFFEGKWQCVDNEDFRESEECGFFFPLENDDSPLKILAERDKTVVKLPFKNCSINTSSSMYLDCEKWLPIDKIIAMDKFSLTHWKMDDHILKVLSGNLSSFLNGRVIKLSLTCLPSDDEPCLMFKLKGSITCPFHRLTKTSSPTTVLLINSRTPLKEILIKATTRSYKQTDTVTVSSLALMVEITPSFKPIRTVHVSTTPIVQGSATISFAASTTPFSQSQTTGNVAVHSSLESIVAGRFSTLQSKGKSARSMPHLLGISTSDQHSANTVTMFDGLESIGVNLTSGNNQSSSVEKMATTNPLDDDVLKILLPGTVVGIFVVSVSLLLLCIARRMGNMIRVATDRNVATQGEVNSVSEDATVNGSEAENVSVYELVERGNVADRPDHRNTVASPANQKDVGNDTLHVPKQPDAKEVIYAQPFAPTPGESDKNSTSTSLTGSAGLTSPTNTSRYQSLLAKSTESVLYASRYSVPENEQLVQGSSCERTEQGPSMIGDQSCTAEDLPNTERHLGSQQFVSSLMGPGQERLIGPSASHSSSNNVDDLPNIERKDRYKLKDILVEDLEIETRGANDLFEEMCIPPSVLVSDTAETGNNNCENIRPGHVNAVREHFNSMAQSSTGNQPQRRKGKSVENAQCLNNAASSENKPSPKEKLKAFFKMTL